ncbi:XkdF-like putative serine protease domain-containing protein [uncultured Methanobrevibacter sp.]|uniref:XkdF-like putative serine protease domain-containing protein n=1 Tax=uncultured Methanobrevibacter sp. TaxID=253161 RepID=UPI0025D34257|nr:XkdF-like putative serine protease domain-containing protein [uncultured Methanobrevibacter sp.]
MNEATYITGVVIANGVPDSDGDCLDKKDIKTIFTKYLDRATDVMHTRIKNEGVEVLANWITESDTELNGKVVPSGSWMATFAVTNEELLSSIKDGSISGLSLGSVSEDAMTKKYWFINKSIHYQDLDDLEEVIPLFISFVDKGANQYGLEVMDYNFYINKNDKTGEKMTNGEKNEEPMIPLSAIDKLRDIFSINKSDTEDDDETKIDKEETGGETPEVEDISNKDLLEQLPDAIVKAFVEATKEVEPTPQNDEVINKADKDEEKKEEENDNDSEEEEPEKEEEESEEDEKKKEEVEINKRQTSMTDVVIDNNPPTDFYERTGRDHLGRKIRR